MLLEEIFLVAVCSIRSLGKILLTKIEYKANIALRHLIIDATLPVRKSGDSLKITSQKSDGGYAWQITISGESLEQIAPELKKTDICSAPSFRRGW